MASGRPSGFAPRATQFNRFSNHSHEVLLQLQSRHYRRTSVLQLLRSKLRHQALSQDARESKERRGVFPLREQGTLDSTAQGALLGHDSLVLPVPRARLIARDRINRCDSLLLPAPPEFARHGPRARHAPDHSGNTLVGLDSNSTIVPRAYPQNASTEA
jgi:hypothetical protein